MQRPNGSLISYFSNLAERNKGINLAQGIPGFNPPKELIDILNLKIHSKSRLHQYAPGKGDPALIEQIISGLQKSAMLTRDNILITNGATEAINLIFFYISKTIKDKFTVLSFDPPYESYNKLADFYGLGFEYFSFNPDFSIDFEKLEQRIKDNNVRLITAASPGNPLGKIFSGSELGSLNELSKKLDVFLLFDAVYKDIYFSDTKPVNPLSFKNPNIFYVDSFSKMLSITGWRIGYLAADSAHMKEIFMMHDYTGLSTPNMFQTAIREYLQKYNFGKNYTEYLRRECRISLSSVLKTLESSGFKVIAPDGGYFVWAKIPDGFNDGFEFASKLFDKEGVAVVPGDNFSPFKKDFVRINIAQKKSVIDKVVDRITRFCSF